MDEQTIVIQAVDRYHRLNELLRSHMLREEEVAFIRGRMLELMLLIYTLDEQAIVQMLESSVDTKPEMVSVIRRIRVNLN